MTRKKVQCPIEDASPCAEKGGAWLCHVHHPKSLFRQQTDAKIAERVEARRLFEQSAKEDREARKRNPRHGRDSPIKPPYIPPHSYHDLSAKEKP